MMRLQRPSSCLVKQCQVVCSLLKRLRGCSNCEWRHGPLSKRRRPVRLGTLLLCLLFLLERRLCISSRRAIAIILCAALQRRRSRHARVVLRRWEGGVPSVHCQHLCRLHGRLAANGTLQLPGREVSNLRHSNMDVNLSGGCALPCLLFSAKPPSPRLPSAKARVSRCGMALS